jgi:hypothetical protein
VNARTIPGFAIGIDRTTVPDCLERGNAVFHNLAAGFARDRNNKTHTARGMFIFGFV